MRKKMSHMPLERRIGVCLCIHEVDSMFVDPGIQLLPFFSVKIHQLKQWCATAKFTFWNESWEIICIDICIYIFIYIYIYINPIYNITWAILFRPESVHKHACVYAKLFWSMEFPLLTLILFQWKQYMIHSRPVTITKVIMSAMWCGFYNHIIWIICQQSLGKHYSSITVVNETYKLMQNLLSNHNSHHTNP